jgi:hypothetical protein
MSFFPLCNINNTKGSCRVHNFSPNNWEKVSSGDKVLWALYSDGNKWISKKVSKLKEGESKTIFYNNFNIKTEDNVSPLIALQLRDTPLPPILNELPINEFQYSSNPEWRSTVAFSYKDCQTSYQGEINPFPERATLLTFHPFIQYGDIENYFVFVNLESSPKYRYTKIEIYDSNTKKFIDEVEVRSNSINVFPLNQYNIKQENLPIFLCRNMAGIPFGFGINRSGPMLSLEHTHPPGSFVVHGARFNFQRQIKKSWFEILKKR